MKFFNPILIFFVNLFNLKIVVDSKQVRRNMLAFFHFKEWGYETTITKVEVYRQKGQLIVLIETHRPGILIGRAGAFIDELNKWLTEELNEPVKIDLKECKIWHKLY